MHQASKFGSINGEPDEEQIENWVAQFYQSMSNIFNSFFSKVDLEEAVSRISLIPFEDMVREQLQGESEQVITIAVAKMKELIDTELEIMRAYIG